MSFWSFMWLRVHNIYEAMIIQVMKAHLFKKNVTQLYWEEGWDIHRAGARVGAKLLQSCRTLCNPVNCSPPDSSVHGILQERILECVAISYSRTSSPPRDGTCVSNVSCIGRPALYIQPHLGRFIGQRGGAKNSMKTRLFKGDWNQETAAFQPLTLKYGHKHHKKHSKQLKVTSTSLYKLRGKLLVNSSYLLLPCMMNMTRNTCLLLFSSRTKKLR